MKYPEVTNEITIESKGRTYYFEDQEKGLPSVTTIISHSDISTKEAIEEWKNNVGHDHANFITSRSAKFGSMMHDIISYRLISPEKEEQLPKSFIYNVAERMASKIISERLEPHLDELYGSEVPIYYPDLYAGRMDCVGVYKGKESIIDFKNSYNHKDESHMHNYKIQCAAYATAHNALLGTNIQQGVILICTVQDMEVREIIIEGEEFEFYKRKWLEYVTAYYQDSIQ